MIIEKELKKLFHQLNEREAAQISLDGFDVCIRVLNNESKLSLSTVVYLGGNYIPGSVRNCISLKNPFSHSIMHTSLSIDEDTFQIHLNYLGLLENVNTQKFIDLLEEFTHIAQEWKSFLDDHDKNDLVYVRINR